MKQGFQHGDFDALVRAASDQPRRTVLRALCAFAVSQFIAACDPIRCPKGQRKCGTICVDTNSDRSFCGGCGGEPGFAVCVPGTFCSGGKCIPCQVQPCGSGQQYDLATCQCTCLPNSGCPFHQRFDPTVCQCACEDPNKVACGPECCNLGEICCGDRCCSGKGCCPDGTCASEDGRCCTSACDPSEVCCTDAFGNCCPKGTICAPNVDQCIEAPGGGGATTDSSSGLRTMQKSSRIRRSPLH